MLNYIAVLGFAKTCPERNQAIAFKAGQELAKLGFGVTAGNLLGTPSYAFNGAKKCHGTTLAILEQEQKFFSHQYCDIVEIVPNCTIKHDMLAELCVGAVVIGGGSGTLKLIQKLIAQSKPVVVIQNTGGISNNELLWPNLNKHVTMYPNLRSAISYGIQFWGKQNQEAG